MTFDDDRVIEAIDRAYQICGDKEFMKTSATMFAHNHQTVASLVGAETPDLGFAAVVRGSKRVEMGFAAVMQDRLIAAWQTGFRSRPESRTIPYSNVTGVHVAENGPDRSLGKGPLLTISCADGHHEEIGFQQDGLSLAKEVAVRLEYHCRRLHGV